MVGLYTRCLFDLDSKAPSIDTALHAFLPFNHIDHLHPDAVIGIGKNTIHRPRNCNTCSSENCIYRKNH